MYITCNASSLQRTTKLIPRDSTILRRHGTVRIPDHLRSQTVAYYSSHLVPARRSVVTGAAGNLEGRSALGNTSAFPDYVAWASDAYYGFSLLKFLDRQHIEVQFIKSDDGTILDTATLFKKHDVQFVGA